MNKKLGVIATCVFTGVALANNVVQPAAPLLDRPTLTALGVQLPISGDDNFNASVTVRYRPSGSAAWRQALPLFRVHPESTVLWNLAPQFAGSIFDLRPNTSYDIELHVTDPDGPVDRIFNLTAATRSVPGDPATPRQVAVQDATSLNNALRAAQPGDVITLADGVYNVSSLFFFGSGTAQNPIVIRGASQDGTVLDGGGCVPCNILEIYGSFVHIERMTLRNAERAIRFQTDGTQGNVIRRVHIKNTTLGIGTRGNALDYYIADNILEGRLVWPSTWRDDNGIHATDDGINVAGFGHVVAHNRISGYGDAMKTSQRGARAVDFYGNDILWTYDNGLELDGSEGNTRCFRNRFTNTYGTMSVQPILGGPAYLLRNVVVNVADEQMKFHAEGTQPPSEPNGVLAYHNTFVSPDHALNLQTPNTSHHFAVENNLFVGPTILSAPWHRVVDWSGPIDDGLFDYNGYFPDGPFQFTYPSRGYVNWSSFAIMQAGAVETHGTVLNGPIFASGLIGPPSYFALLAPQDVTLAPGSSALDRGLVLPNINDGFTGSAPDLGALEFGCPAPIYGPRPAGTDESNEPFGCNAVTPPPLPPPPPPVSISVAVNPASLTMHASQVQPFQATVTGSSNQSVTWTANPNLGLLLQNGLYIAPPQIDSPLIVQLTATSVADPSKSATSLVALQPTLRVWLGPFGVTLRASQSQQYRAAIIGAQDNSVTWIVQPALGTITPGGLYTAPASIASRQVVTLTAISNIDHFSNSSIAIFLAP